MGFYYSDDPVNDFLRHDAEQSAWENDLPTCEYCDQPIQDVQYYEIDGAAVHKECLKGYCDEHFKTTNNYL